MRRKVDTETAVPPRRQAEGASGLPSEVARHCLTESWQPPGICSKPPIAHASFSLCPDAGVVAPAENSTL